MVEVFSHVGEGFVADLTPVKWICNMHLSAKGQNEEKCIFSQSHFC